MMYNQTTPFEKIAEGMKDAAEGNYAVRRTTELTDRERMVLLELESGWVNGPHQFEHFVQEAFISCKNRGFIEQVWVISDAGLAALKESQ